MGSIRIPSKEARGWLGPFSLGRFILFRPFPAVLETLASACLSTGEITMTNLSTFLSVYCPDGWMESVFHMHYPSSRQGWGSGLYVCGWKSIYIRVTTYPICLGLRGLLASRALDFKTRKVPGKPRWSGHHLKCTVLGTENLEMERPQEVHNLIETWASLEIILSK